MKIDLKTLTDPKKLSQICLLLGILIVFAVVLLSGLGITASKPMYAFTGEYNDRSVTLELMQGKVYKLTVADADGENASVIDGMYDITDTSITFTVRGKDVKGTIEYNDDVLKRPISVTVAPYGKLQYTKPKN